MKTLFKLSALSIVVLAAACVAPVDEPGNESVEDDGAALSAQGDKYYIVTRPDYRKCISPVCSGDFVKLVNRKKTKCFASKKAEDCYVGGYDFSALGLDPATEAKLRQAVRAGEALVLGHYESYNQQFPHIARLVVSDAWLGVSGDDPHGRFYDVSFNGVQCVTYPCPSYDAKLLNRKKTITLAGVDLGQTSASNQQVQAGYAALATTGVILAGHLEKVTGPAGTAKGVVASEFYSIVASSPVVPGEQCGSNVCGKGSYCCNASCGICAPLNFSCIQIACNQI